MFNTDERYEMEIVDLSTQGEGIGKVEGLAIFVPGAIPGETVKVRIAEHKKSIARGIVEKIITPSPYRIKPFCKYEGNCGGCGLQSIRYDGQLIIKKKWVKDRLSRIGGIEDPVVHDVIPMEDPVIYRNKAQYVVARVTGEEKKLRACTVGFHRARTHEAIDIDHCPIQTEAANRGSSELCQRVQSSGVRLQNGNRTLAASDRQDSIWDWRRYGDPGGYCPQDPGSRMAGWQNQRGIGGYGRIQLRKHDPQCKSNKTRRNHGHRVHHPGRKPDDHRRDDGKAV